jgi:glycosyl hydrolase family 99
MARLAWFVCLAAASTLFTGQHRTAPALDADPATNLVRTRAFLTTTTSSLDLAIDGASLANAVFTLRHGDPSVRTATDGNTIRVTRNPQGSTADFEIDMILADVPAHATVGWTLTAEAPARTRLEIQNVNSGQSPVDAFDLEGAAARFTSRTDLLRDGGPIGPVVPIDSHLVLAFFYPWWNRDSWSSPLYIDRPVQPYSTSDPADLVRVLTQAKSAGLDALVVSWSGKDFDGGIDNRRMLACLAAAQSAGIRIATLFETTVANPQHVDGNADPDTVFRWLVDVVDTYATHDAYLRVGGRPVVLAYAAQRMSQPGWAEALARLRASGRDVLLIGEGINATRLGALDGLFFYASNVYQGDEIRDFDRAQSLSVRTYHLLPNDTHKRRIWVADVSPGYDDTHLLDGRVARVSDRDGGRYYARQWQRAIDMRADWVVVTSWNEWFENTQIEPSVRYGDLYVRLTRMWAESFRRRYAVPRLTKTDFVR